MCDLQKLIHLRLHHFIAIQYLNIGIINMATCEKNRYLITVLVVQTQFHAFFLEAPQTVMLMLSEWMITSESQVTFYTSWRLNYVYNIPQYLYHIKKTMLLRILSLKNPHKYLLEIKGYFTQ